MSIWRRKSEELRASALKVRERGSLLRAGAHRVAHTMLDRILNVVLSPVRFFKALCFTIGFVFILLTVGTGLSLYSFVSDLPRVDKLKLRDLRMIAEGKVSQRLGDRRRYFRWVALDDMSREYLYAIVTSEDATYFEHNGFNFEAIANSFAENIKEQRLAYGGSTISQQVVKNLFLTNEKTVSRKIKELFITRSLENHFSKNEILEIYLNIAEFGPDIVGVNAAALQFFKKAPSRINAAEGAFIALMLPAPKRHYYTIFQNKNLTRVKRKKIERVLRDMLYEEYLTDNQYGQYVRYDFFPGRLPAGAAKPKPQGADDE